MEPDNGPSISPELVPGLVGDEVCCIESPEPGKKKDGKGFTCRSGVVSSAVPLDELDSLQVWGGGESDRLSTSVRHAIILGFLQIYLPL